MKLTLKLFTLFLVVVVSSCKKEFKETQQKTAYLTKPAGWLTVKTEEKSSAGEWKDTTPAPNPLNDDNLLIFDPFFGWAINEGPLKLPEDRQVPYFGTWKFIDNDTKVQIIGGNAMEILELTDNKFMTLIIVDGVSRRYTYKHP